MLIIITFIPMIIIGVIVKLETSGPSIFIQRIVGKDSKVFNILKDEMSFIGPKPWPAEQCKHFTKFQKLRHDVLPGITGLAQINRNENISIFDKIEFDIDYVNNLSFNLDTKILFQTMKVELNKSGTIQSKSRLKTELIDLKEHYQFINNKLSLETTKLLLLQYLDRVLNTFKSDYRFDNINDVKNIENEMVKKLQI